MGNLIQALNGGWHEKALKIFMVIVVVHWFEHLFQAFQIYVMHWPRHKSLGMLGLVFPWLVHSEWMHYAYAVVMLLGLIALRRAFAGRSRIWWNIALWIQLWHFVEHSLLLGQALLHHNLFGAKVPTSIIQLLIPRVELHLFYNAIVTIPMIIGMYYHIRRPYRERKDALCGCGKERP